LVSVATQIPVRADVAMTGEITLRGEVLPIGGLKEKLLAARRGGIKTVIIPRENERDLKEVPENIKQDLDISAVKWIDEVLSIALEKTPQPLSDKEYLATPPQSGKESAADTDDARMNTH
ncbi:MAG: S16 family serine protease, partial [Chromatocurvus sp.]